MKQLTAVILLCVTASAAQANNWPQFRGPFFNGSTDETKLPAQWSETENVAWTATLPGPGAGTPAVWGDRVFLSAADPESDTLKALSIDRKTGKVLWTHDISQGTRRTHRSNFASASPATDGAIVVFFFGNGQLATFDVEGKKLWTRNIQEDYGTFAFLWTFASSPLLYRGKLYIQVLQRDVPVDGRGFADRKNESYLLALEPKTGKEIWRVLRPSEARAESLEAFSSPIPYESKERRVILVCGGDALTGHDPETGAELFRWGTYNPERIGHWRLVPSPVAGEDIALVCAPKRDPVYAIRITGSGELGPDAVAWVSSESRNVTSDVPTPAYHDGDFFILSDVRKSLSRVDARTGQVKWSIETPGYAKYEASPLVADGRVFLVNFEGEVVIVDAKEGRILHVIPTHPTDEYPVRSSIVAAQGQLFIRTNRKLLCIGGE